MHQNKKFEVFVALNNRYNAVKKKARYKVDDMLSVIVPVYNMEQYVGECIQSILNQSYTNLECIIVDDGSTDGSGVICDQYAEKDSRVKVYHQKNTGRSSARNVGVRHMTGRYLGFVDSDDVLLPEM